MNLNLHIRNFTINLGSEPIEAGNLQAEYRPESHELVVIYQMPDQAIQIETDEGSVSLQIQQFELHLSNDAARYLAAYLPPEVLH